MTPIVVFFAEQIARVRQMLVRGAQVQRPQEQPRNIRGQKDLAEPTHGTLSRYTHRGCRCLRCGTAHAAYQQRYRERAKGRQR